MSIWIETKLKESEIGKIPLDWSCTTLNKIADINPKPIKLDSDGIEVSFVGMADVSESAKLMNTTNRLYGEVKKGFTSFQDNDVLVAKITPCFENGKGALVSNLTNGIGFGSTEFHVIRAKEQKGCPEFIHHITTTHNFRVKGEMNMTGTAGQKRVGKEFIASYLIACPPFVEQQKIAEVLSTVDKKIDLIDQKIAETEKLKTGLMQKLFSEGVGVQDENGNWQPHTEFKDSKLGKIPDSWNLGTVKDISPLQGGYAFKSKSATESGVRWLKIANVGKRRVTWDNDSYLPEKFIEEHSDFLLNEGDIVIALTRPVLSGELKVARLSGKDAPALLNQRVARINVNCSVADPGFVYYLFEDKRMANSISKVILGTDPPNISTKQIESFDIAIPPLEEQKSIRKVLSSVSSKIDLLVQQKAETQQLKKGLMQKLLTGEWRVPVEETEAA
ncbi:restriction endonuclease subunit S [Vibrio alginolyticus]|uniref:restriction endonuclease subunit S n=1 Tax=Vibrio alginolyticus TaxID=663 RepID=UPI00215D3134|nr:restriction endonuclease subunit S [Vibrio alginolyticus]MCR9353393.1 restriction endonuclease subunit S [Vibrio alginolyticus]MCR9362298.1 restriction endonuclease subunit S [Vibrio alginolyticus]